jgi:hypothetical protein
VTLSFFDFRHFSVAFGTNPYQSFSNPWYDIVPGSDPIERLTNEIHDSYTYTEVIVVQIPKQGVTAQQIMAVMPSEIRATVNLYLDGKIRQWYSRGDGEGVIFLVDAKTEDEARAVVETLPLAKEQLMDDEYIPVGPLMPLRALIGPGAQQ